MKKFIIIILLFTQCFVIKSQNLFKIGLKHFQKGEYSIADSLFSLYLKKAPKDKNAHYNHGVTRLYLGDTCGFCNEMLVLKNYFHDKDANDLYFKICGTLDTLFYDEQFRLINKKEARFTEIVENHRYINFKIVDIHDKKSKGKTEIINFSDIPKSQKTDIIATYRLYNDSSKVFVYSLTPPTFPGGDDAKSSFREKSPYVEQAKNELGLSEFTADIEYIVDKEGNIRNVILTGTKYKIENVDVLMKYINLFISSMPKQTPAKFRDENVDFLVTDFISFW